MSAQTTAENEVREVAKQHAKAMNKMVSGDASHTADIWSQTTALTALHPVGNSDVGGWDTVKKTYEGFASGATDGSWRLEDQAVYVLGDVAYETGTETVAGKLGGHSYDFQTRVTNIYQREAGGWKMVHHHAETVPALIELMKKLQPQ